MSPSKEATPLIRSLFHCKKKGMAMQDRDHCNETCICFRGSSWLRLESGWIYIYIWNRCHFSFEFDFHPWSGVINKTLCDKVVLFAPGILLSFIKAKTLISFGPGHSILGFGVWDLSNKISVSYCVIWDSQWRYQKLKIKILRLCQIWVKFDVFINTIYLKVINTYTNPLAGMGFVQTPIGNRIWKFGLIITKIRICVELLKVKISTLDCKNMCHHKFLYHTFLAL